MTLARFSRRMAKRGDQVQPNTNLLVRAIALQSLTTVSFATPVDTGRARSNWQVSIGKPLRSQLESFAGDQPSGGSESQRAANGAIATQTSVARGNTTIGQYKGQGGIFLSNNVDYINELNLGSSPQAGRDFVGTAVRESVKAVVNSPRFRGIIQRSSI